MDPNKARLAQTIVLVLTWVNMGLNINMLYAVLPDILTRTNSTVEEMSMAFSLGNLGGLFVPFFAILADKLVAYEETILGLFLLVCGVAVGMRGFAIHVWQHIISSMLEGFFWGSINSVGQSSILRQWGVESGPAMQAIHMGYPIGAILAPFLAVPFVSDTEEDTTLQLTTTHLKETTCQNDLILRYRNSMMKNIATLKSYASELITGGDEQVDSIATTGGFILFDENVEGVVDTYEYADDSSIGIALGICAIFSFTIGVLHLILQFLITPKREKTKIENVIQTEEKVSDNEEKEEIANPKPTFREIISFDNWAYGHGKFGCSVLVLISLFFICHLGATMGITIYLVTYAVDSDLGFSNEEAAWMQMTVSIAAAFSRGICIVISKKVPLNIMIAVELHGQVLMGVIMLIWGSQSYVGLWVTSCIYVLFREPTWPSGMTWLNNFIIVLVFLLAIVQICLSIGNIPLQYWQGYLYSNKSPDTIFYTTIVFGSLNCIVFYFMLYIGRKAPKRDETKKLDTDYEAPKGIESNESIHTYNNLSYAPENNPGISTISTSTYL